ncbi:uncharacterized protein I303_106401 [Kwoniella dejecticola CBS 10117]|uniref:WD-repeat protein 68 n=1 Tax=Kwoniella dejecticola CBS 10117 TaxID=1296121 RepID=A0A1A5ZUT9_9TREE|nr:WD-repeat protein 68 [Kwoniella dejecticola CBS 10117]OBR81570.1 WD-repeat protein 68 [Kwoniella dejecticola CBS 10117]
MGSQRLLQYDSGYPLYGVSFSNSSSHPSRIALTTINSSATNKLIVVDQQDPYSRHNPHHHHHSHHSHSHHNPNQDFQQLASTPLTFPATKVGWEPRESLSGVGYGDNGGRGELIATSGDALRLFEVTKEWNSDGMASGYIGKNGWSESEGSSSYSVKSRSMLTNSKTPHASLPPVTSFSWNPKAPHSIVTCSIDTTATLWDINTSQALTQLIAHDRAVYDLSWLPDSSDIFVSVGADGSLRAFDLRQLEHSTILYESSKDTPLARIAFSKKEQHMMACFGLDDNKVLVLDMRSPGQPVAELVGHTAPLGGLAWGAPGRGDSTGGGWIASCGDDSQLLLYDLTQPLPESRPPSTKPTNSHQTSRTNSSNPYGALSPPITPNSHAHAQRPLSTGQSQSQSRSRSRADSSTTGTSASGEPIEILPVKAWNAQTEINNLAFNEKGDWVGCVSGTRLNVLAL